MIIESRNLPGLYLKKKEITLFHIIPVYRHLNKEVPLWCNLMLTDISNEFYISQIYSSAYLFRGHHPHNQNSQNKSNKGCTFQVDTWGYTWGGTNVSET